MVNIANKVVEIEGRRCIVIRDEVSISATESAGILVDQELLTDNYKLWMSSEVMDELASKHGGLPIFGLWQVLLSSGYIEGDYKVFVVPTNENGDGHYLYRDNSIWRVGIVFQDELQGLPDEYLTSLTDDDILLLEIEVEELSRPAKRVLSITEQATVKSKEQKIVRRQVVAAVCSVAAVLFGVERYLDFMHKKEKMEYESEQTVLTSLNARIQILKTDRATFKPDQQADVFPIWYLTTVLPPESMESEKIVLSDPGAQVIIIKKYSHLAEDLPTDVFTARPVVTGEAIVNWKVAVDE